MGRLCLGIVALLVAVCAFALCRAAGDGKEG